MTSRDDKLYIVMVGLPARGKSTIAVRIKETFKKNNIPTRIFNNGNLRRRYMPQQETYRADFYNPSNQPAADLRQKFALMNIRSARRYLNDRGRVAILDATNVSLDRRLIIEQNLNDHPLLFIECINEDEDILYLSKLQKLRSPEFESLARSLAFEEFTRRILYYEMIYTRLQHERNFIRMDSLHNQILEEKIADPLPLYSRIRDILVTDIVKNLYLIRHTQTFFNVEDRIGGDSPLTPKGEGQARALATCFQNRKLAYIFTSQKKRTIQTAVPIRDRQKDCVIVPLKELNEIDGGICEGMSYDEIQKSMPEVYSARKTDKYHYAYPQGEGYASMRQRIQVGIKKAFFLNRNSDNIMIIGHRAVNRMLLSHFLYRREEDVPYIYVPQDKYYHIVATQDKKLFALKKYA